MAFKTAKFSASDRFEIGTDDESDILWLGIPVSNSMVDFLEYYRITREEYNRFLADLSAGLPLAERCRQRLEDDRLIFKYPPGAPRGTPM